MFSNQQLLTLFLILTMELNLTACGAEGTTQPTPEMPELRHRCRKHRSLHLCHPRNQSWRSRREQRPIEASKWAMYSMPGGDIHYHIYVPDGYNGSKAYALFLTLPGYEGLYFQGMGRSLYSENFAFEALNYNDHMIVAVPQLSGLGGDFN